MKVGVGACKAANISEALQQYTNLQQYCRFVCKEIKHLFRADMNRSDWSKTSKITDR